MLTGFFYIELKYICIKMLGCAINVNRATSFAGFLIRKDYECLLALINLCGSMVCLFHHI